MKEERQQQTINVFISRTNINPEDALEQTNKKFIKRFGYMETKVKEQGKQIADCKLEELDKYWNEAKKL